MIYDKEFKDIVDKSELGKTLAKQAHEAMKRPAFDCAPGEMPGAPHELSVLMDWLFEQELVDDAGNGFPAEVVSVLLARWAETMMERIARLAGDTQDEMRRRLQDVLLRGRHAPRGVSGDATWSWVSDGHQGDRLAHSVRDPAGAYLRLSDDVEAAYHHRVCNHTATTYCTVDQSLAFQVFEAPGCDLKFAKLITGHASLEDVRRIYEEANDHNRGWSQT